MLGKFDGNWSLPEGEVDWIKSKGGMLESKQMMTAPV